MLSLRADEWDVDADSQTNGLRWGHRQCAGNLDLAQRQRDSVGGPWFQSLYDTGSGICVREPVGGWVNGTETAKLAATDGQTGDQLGYSASISGNTVVAGAPLAAIGVNQAQGAIYVFTKPVGGWSNVTQTAKLTASDGGPNQSLVTRLPRMAISC